MSNIKFNELVAKKFMSYEAYFVTIQYKEEAYSFLKNILESNDKELFPFLEKSEITKYKKTKFTKETLLTENHIIWNLNLSKKQATEDILKADLFPLAEILYESPKNGKSIPYYRKSILSAALAFNENYEHINKVKLNSDELSNAIKGLCYEFLCQDKHNPYLLKNKQGSYAYADIMGAKKEIKRKLSSFYDILNIKNEVIDEDLLDKNFNDYGKYLFNQRNKINNHTP